MSALVIVGHGSQDPEAVAKFLRLVGMCQIERPGTVIEHGFLEFAAPGIAEAIGRCAERGSKTVIVSPAILLEAGHARNDIPAEIDRARPRYPDLEIFQARPLGLHPRIIDLCELRIAEAKTAHEPCPGEETGLLVVGRGSSDADANSEVVRLASLLAARMQLAGSSVCFVDLGRPLLTEALDNLRNAPLARMIVLPFLLFTGVLEKRIRQLVQDAVSSGLRLIYAGPLNAHPYLVQALLERAEEAAR